MSASHVAVVTGATQPLGRALARGLARKGFCLALVDAPGAELEALQQEIGSNRIRVSTHVADPADPRAAAGVAQAVLKTHGCADLLFASARAATPTAFADLPEAEFSRVLSVVASTPIALTRALLPSLRNSEAGRVVVFAGRAGLDAVGAGAADAAAQFALRGFAGGLGNECALAGRGGVSIVYALGSQSPGKVARAAIDGALARRRRILTGAGARALSWLDRLLPVAQERLPALRARHRAPPGRSMVLAGRTAVVTGGGSGIGRGIARALAARGCNLALVDRDAGGLDGTVSLLGSAAGRIRITTHLLDVTDAGATRTMRDAVLASHGGVDLLFNNAGVALGGEFADVSAEEFDWLLGINLDAVVDLTRLFLPALRRSDDSRLVFTSSLFGLIAPPGQVAYSTSKFAVRGFATALRCELAGTSAGVTVVHPGGIRTAIARNARIAEALAGDARVQREQAAIDRFLRMDPDRAGEIIVAGTQRRMRRILVGVDAKVFAALERITPVGYAGIMRWLLARASGEKRS